MSRRNAQLLSCRTVASYFAGSYVISRACSTLSLVLRPRYYIHPWKESYFSRHRFSRGVAVPGRRSGPATVAVAQPRAPASRAGETRSARSRGRVDSTLAVTGITRPAATALVMEVLFTFALAFVVLNVATSTDHHRRADPGPAPPALDHNRHHPGPTIRVLGSAPPAGR